MSLKSALIAAFSIFMAPVVYADQMGPDGDKFYEAAAHFENACQTYPCVKGFDHKITYSYAQEINTLSPAILNRLKQVAKVQSSAWDSSFFDKNLYLGERSFLYEVRTMFKFGKIIGYKVKYSLKAWDLDTCPELTHPDQLANCKSGRISEGSYVSADFQTFFSDEERAVTFKFTHPQYANRAGHSEKAP